MKSSLSQAQLGVYYAFETSVNEESNYQNPVLLTLPADVDIKRLQEAVYGAICAHPYVAGRIETDDEGRPWVVTDEIHASADDTVPVREVTEAEWTEVQNTFAQTMDIHSDRLFRAEIYTVQSQCFFYLDIHHVLADGFSMTVLLRDVERLYNGKKAAGEIFNGTAIASAE